jgi:hypothetical protein
MVAAGCTGGILSLVAVICASVTGAVGKRQLVAGVVGPLGRLAFTAGRLRVPEFWL